LNPDALRAARSRYRAAPRETPTGTALNRLLGRVQAGIFDLELEGPRAGGRRTTDWLDGLADEDRHLRPTLIDLLSQSEATGFVTAGEPPTAVARLAAEALSGMRREAAGDRIGPWRLERLLAEGGMGAVWEAARADGVMQRRAALKLPRAEWVDHGLAQRLARERAILARLQHPHIAVLFDAGLADGGRPYLALEYVDGVPIDAYCKGRELKDVLRLMVQVIRAVAYAHGQLVIHRDLKPANVLVTPDGSPKLLDFGISKLIEGDAPTAEATALTRLAGRPMTLAYAAPEQVLALPVTVAADVYALGVMLAELLAGARLYRATEPRALEAEILTGDLRLPSAIAADKARARLLKGDLDAIVATALKRQPAERYDSAAALADDLQRYLDGKPVRAQPDSTAYRLKKFVARNALAVGAASAIVLALGAGLGVALWQGFEARQQAQRATALNTFVLGLIRTADPNASAQTKAADVAMLNTIEQRIDSEFHGSPDQLLQLRVTVGEAYKNRGEMKAAQRVFQKAVDQAAPHTPANDLTLLTAQVRASDPSLIVSSAAATQLEHAIES
jgi:tRNA A-37 threonylcarbamoyl transferase component Bud32